MSTPAVRRLAVIRRRAESLFLGLLVLLAIVAGLLTSQRWPSADSDFFATIAQIIATLFIAITVEFFAQLPGSWRGLEERIVIGVLLVLSWTGLFASIAALAVLRSSTGIDPLPWLGGLAGTGLIAASAVVSLSFSERLRGKDRPRPTMIAVAFVIPPVLLLGFL